MQIPYICTQSNQILFWLTIMQHKYNKNTFKMKHIYMKNSVKCLPAIDSSQMCCHSVPAHAQPYRKLKYRRYTSLWPTGSCCSEHSVVTRLYPALWISLALLVLLAPALLPVQVRLIRDCATRSVQPALNKTWGENFNQERASAAVWGCWYQLSSHPPHVSSY